MPKRGDEQERGSAGVGETPMEARRAEDSKMGGELRRFEPVSDELVLAAIDRAECHRVGDREGVPFWTVVAHLGFVRSGWTSRRLRPQLEGLVTQGLVSSARRQGFDVWGLTDAGRERLGVARRTGGVEELPESPQHRAWCRARAVAGERIDGFRERAKRGTEEAAVLLRSSRRVRSDTWLELAARLELVYRQLGRATYCLYEWMEPEDATADIDDYKDPGDEQLDRAARVRLRSLRSARRNVAGPWVNEYGGEAVSAPTGVIITVPAEMVGEIETPTRDPLRHVLRIEEWVCVQLVGGHNAGASNSCAWSARRRRRSMALGVRLWLRSCCGWTSRLAVWGSGSRARMSASRSSSAG